MESRNYKELLVWQKSMKLVEQVYVLTKKFPREETFGMTSQMKRCATSIPSNIAEGSRRRTNKDFCHFLFIAYGSGAELETQLELAKRLGLAPPEPFTEPEQLLDEIMRMLNRLTAVIEAEQVA